jgi:hypothetical protein
MSKTQLILRHITIFTLGACRDSVDQTQHAFLTRNPILALPEGAVTLLYNNFTLTPCFIPISLGFVEYSEDQAAIYIMHA